MEPQIPVVRTFQQQIRSVIPSASSTELLTLGSSWSGGGEGRGGDLAGATTVEAVVLVGVPMSRAAPPTCFFIMDLSANIRSCSSADKAAAGCSGFAVDGEDAGVVVAVVVVATGAGVGGSGGDGFAAAGGTIAGVTDTDGATAVKGVGALVVEANGVGALVAAVNVVGALVAAVNGVGALVIAVNGVGALVGAEAATLAAVAAGTPLLTADGTGMAVLVVAVVVVELAELATTAVLATDS